jgi:hypothetical protein
MTSVEILFRTAAPPSSIDAVTRALANIREVYGIHRLTFDRAARTLRVEYDATRLNAAAVAKLVRQAGLEIEADLPLIAPQPASGAGARGLGFSNCAAGKTLIFCLWFQPCAPVAQLKLATNQ